MQLACIELRQDSMSMVLAIQGAEAAEVDKAVRCHANECVGMIEDDEREGERRGGFDEGGNG